MQNDANDGQRGQRAAVLKTTAACETGWTEVRPLQELDTRWKPALQRQEQREGLRGGQPGMAVPPANLFHFWVVAIKSSKPFTMAVSAQPGFKRDPRTWNVSAPNAVSFAM